MMLVLLPLNSNKKINCKQNKHVLNNIIIKKKLKKNNILSVYKKKHINILYIKNKNIIYMLKKNGDILWKFYFTSDLLFQPTIKKNKLLVVLKNNHLLVINFSNGCIILKKFVKNKIISKPFLKKKYLFINTILNSLFIINIKSSKIIWSHKNFYLLEKIIFHKKIFSLLYSRYIFNFFSNGNLICFNQFSGKIRWKTQFHNILIKNKPIIYKNNLYIYNEKNLRLYIFEINKGKIILNLKINNKILYMKLIKNNLLILLKNGFILNFYKKKYLIWKKKILYNRKAKFITNKHKLLLIKDNNKYYYILNLKNGNLICLNI